MSILGKLFKGKAEEAAKELFNGLLNGSASKPKPAETPRPAAYESKAPAQAAPFGVSWGERMPDEENQYSFHGSYQAYFETIFREEFPQYVLQSQQTSSGCVITFFAGAERALVVELKSEHSEANKLRNDCRREGVPYLRFYHNHPGWWNTRSYVLGRTHAALGR